MSIKDYSTTAGSNTLSPPNGWPEGMTIANVNNTGRQMMADIRNLCAEDTIASATTCDLGTKDATFLTISGTTTITSFGTVSAGIYKLVRFSGALTLTHNATSLILLTGANRTTVAGDCALFKSEGSGNWREYFYFPVGSYQPLDATLTALASALSAANKIPYATALNTLGELDLSTNTSLGTSNTTISTQNAVKTYVDTSVSGLRALTSMVAKSASGTSVDFTSIPNWVKKITLMFSGVTTSGTSTVLVRIGDSGGLETTSYVSTGSGISNIVGTTNYTDGFGISDNNSSGPAYSGSLTISLLDGTTWTEAGNLFTSSNKMAVSAGAKSLSGTLDRLSITTSGGTETFTAGTINILYE